MTDDGARMHRLPETMLPLARDVLTYAVERIRMDPPPLDGPIAPEVLAARVGETITPDGIGGDEALRLWSTELGPACLSQDHPRSLSFVPAAPTEAAVLFDLVVGASSIYGGSWLEGAGAVFVENQALRWLADLAGLGDDAGGAFVTGGTAGNLGALVTARDTAKRAWRGAPPRRWIVAASSAAHSSVDAVARVMDVDVLEVAAERDGRMRADALRRALDDRDVAAGEVFAVVATAGTTNTGRIDELAAIAGVCTDEDLWLHVDAAYGGAALAAPSARAAFDGIERADSLVVDPHKWLFAPFDCAALLYQNPVLARLAHTQTADYLEPIRSEGDWNPSDYAFHLSRRARGLPFWFSLATHGTRAYADAVESTLALTAAAADAVRGAEHLELVLEPELSIVLLRRRGWGPPDYSKWSQRMLVEQVAISLPTKHAGETVLRWCFVNPRTTIDDVELLVDALR